jgi:hypothetical protein
MNDKEQALHDIKVKLSELELNERQKEVNKRLNNNVTREISGVPMRAFIDTLERETTT